MKLDIKKEVVGRLPLVPVEDTVNGGYKFKGIIPAKLVKVEIVNYKHEKGEFAGTEVPELHFEFTNYKTSSTEPDRFYTHAAKIVTSKKYAEDKETLIDRNAEDIDKATEEMWAIVKSILDGCVKSKNYKDISKINKEDSDKYFTFEPLASAKVRMEQYLNFFNFIDKFVNDEAAPMIPLEGVPMWIKLLPDYDTRTRFVFPRFVGKGIIEPMEFGTNKEVKPPVRLTIYPTESLVLSSKSKGKKDNSVNPEIKTDNEVEDLINSAR